MKIIRRPSGGRGEYELSNPDPTSGLAPKDAVDKEVWLQLPGDLRLRTGTWVKLDSGKHRFRLIDGLGGEGGAIQIARQIAALLLLPEPVRDEAALGGGEPVPSAGKYFVANAEISIARDEGSSILFDLRSVEVTNQDSAHTFDFGSRYRRVRALWANAARFSAEVAHLLRRHEASVRSGRAIGEALEDTVRDLAGLVGDEDVLAALDVVPTANIGALCAKPLLILTGPTGTGKSRSAIELAAWMDYGHGLPPHLSASASPPSTALALVPVGADWTDQRNILGYSNPFGPERTGADGSPTNLTYEITPAVRLLLRAAHPDFASEPHFLVLDEMNLSHVERYFSTFLSIIEADRALGKAGEFNLIGRDEIALIAEVLSDKAGSPLEAESARNLAAEHRGLPFPPNVFIVGTVNVDETTYMFSPKVLDRAFVSELQSVSPADILSGKSAAAASASGANVLAALRQAIERRADPDEHPPTEETLRAAGADAGLSDAEAGELADTVSMALSGVFKLLTPVGFGFGFRVVNEVVEYIAVELALCGLFGRDPKGWREVLDDAVLMKVLPKIHGNRRKLGDSVKALAAFFAGKAAPEAAYSLGTTDTVAITSGEALGIALPRSERKAEDLHRTLQATGYTTFIS
jgi:hypothetical protein